MKRSNNFENNSGKKFKPDPVAEDLWGDDPDVDDLDDCIFRATQISENRENEAVAPQNASIAPSYGAFQVNRPVSSTQAVLNDSFNFARPDNVQKADEDLDQKLRRLQMNYEAKEGEVSVLRMQLKQTKETLEVENLKKQKEYKEQLQKTLREKEEAITKLDMKNLEIANLKRKLLDVTKNATKEIMSQSIIRNAVLNCTQVENVNKLGELRIESSLSNKIYPLKHIVNSMIFKPVTEQRLDLLCVSKNDTWDYSGVNVKSESTRKKSSSVKMEDIYSDIGELLNCDEWELNKSDEIIDRVGCRTLQLMTDILVYFETLKTQIKEDSIRRYDLEYLSYTEQNFKMDFNFFSPVKWGLEERGIQCRQLLALLGELLPYNSHLRNFIMGNICQKYRSIYISSESMQNDDVQLIFLHELLEIVKLIGEMRKSFEFCGFLSAVCHLLRNVFRLQDFNIEDEVCQYFQTIVREIIFSRPSPVVLHHIMLLLSDVSNNTFIESLCKYPAQNALVKKSKKDIYLINNDCCTFQVFSILYKECIWKEECFDIDKCVTVLKFICGVFNMKAKWLYYNENGHHNCLCEVYILAVEVVASVLRKCDKGQVMRNALELSVKTMQLISFKCYELLERKPDHYLHYKMNIRKLLNKCEEFTFCDNDVTALEKLLASSTEDSQNSEEIQNINKIPLFAEL